MVDSVNNSQGRRTRYLNVADARFAHPFLLHRVVRSVGGAGVVARAFGFERVDHAALMSPFPTDRRLHLPTRSITFMA